MQYDVTDIKDTWFKRGKDDPKIYTESLVFYRIKQLLNNAGYDVIKKNPSLDGHMTSMPYYIRDRKYKFCLYDNESDIRSLTEVYNTYKPILLTYHDLKD